MTPALRESTLDLLTVGASKQTSISKDIYEAFYVGLVDDATRKKRALLYTLGVSTRHLKSQFENLLKDNQEPDTELDSVLCAHFEEMITNPRFVLDDGIVRYGEPPHLLFHCIENLIGTRVLGYPY